MSEELKNKKIAIVGGGFTGLTAAYKLAEKGASVTVYEAGSEVGGLASGCTILGKPVEKAYHFLYKTDRHMHKLLRELNLDNDLEYKKSSVSTYYDDHLYPMMNPLDLLRFKPLSFISRIRAGATVLYLQNVKNWQKLTEVTALEWLRKYAGQQVVDVIWAPLLKGKFDRYYDKVTMCWLWGRIKQRVDSRDKELKGEALGYIKGGFITVADELVTRIENAGGKILTSQPIKSMERLNDSSSIAIKSENSVEQFDRVLLTVPCTVAAKLLKDYRDSDPAYFNRMDKIDYLDAAVLLFATEKPITKYYWHNINTPGAPFVVFLSLTSLIGTEKFDGKHVYYIGDYVPREHEYMSMTSEALTEKWFADLKSMFPEFDSKGVLDSQLYRFTDAQHIVDVEFENKIVDHRTPCPGVYLCNFSQIFPMDRGTNYAVRDGMRMAELIESELGLVH